MFILRSSLSQPGVLPDVIMLYKPLLSYSVTASYHCHVLSSGHQVAGLGELSAEDVHHGHCRGADSSGNTDDDEDPAVDPLPGGQ